MNVFCIQCKKVLPASGTTCTGCDAPFTKQNGYIDYTPQSNAYWGELSREETQHLISESRVHGYRQACLSHFKNHRRLDLFEYFLNERGRASFINFIYQRSHAGRCLDLGSGMGAIPAALSKLFEEVYSIELVKERVEFQVIRKEQENIKNWTILKGGLRPLPFPDSYFDFISLNGVLEWAAIADFSDTPANIQHALLTEVLRVLKPNGVCYIGIENRTSINYFRGALDHSGLRYTSLLPRFLANLVCKLKRKKNNFYFEPPQNAKGYRYYRVYTYTRRGYRKLITHAGAKTIRILHTGFSYNLAYASIDDAARSRIPAGIDVIKEKLPQFKHSKNPLLARLFSYLTPNFLIYFTKESTDLRSDFEKNIEKKYGDVGPFYVYRGFNNLTAYSLTTTTFYKSPTIDSHEIEKESKAPGKPATTINEKMFTDIINTLKNRYHTNIQPSSKKLGEFLEWAETQADSYRMCTPTLRVYIKTIRDRYKNHPLFTRTHGDVWLGNTFTHNGTVTLIDEERDPFGVLPIELLRFLHSIVGYGQESQKDIRYTMYVKILADKYPGIITHQVLEDFYPFMLWYEVSRRDLFGPQPRTELFYFLNTIQTTQETGTKNA